MNKAATLTSKTAAKEPFLGVLRELVRAYQAFTAYDAAHLSRYGLTQPQADVVFTLGNTPGMTFKELGEKTLITKGTLTGVIDRLERKGFVKRAPSATDRRCTMVVLTTKGEQWFDEVFPAHIAYIKERLERLSKQDLEETEEVLRRLRAIL